jgi:uroporphyrinogen-III decarboxylase
MAAVMVGTEDFVVMLLDDPDLCWQLMDFTTAVSAEMFHLLHENGCDIALPAEPVGSGSMISPDMFEEFTVPALTKLREELSEYQYFFTHVCGHESKSRVSQQV